MLATITIDNEMIEVDLSSPLDISIPVQNKGGVNAWYVNQAEIEPQQLGDWKGSIEKGASVNFNRIAFNPHSHGTHTENIGHILSDVPSVNETLNQYFFKATLITVKPTRNEIDFQITKSILEHSIKSNDLGDALIIRTTPNSSVAKKTKDHSHTNWPYFTKEAMEYIVSLKVEHLLVDTPSVDKEKDNGKLVAHHTFWQTQRYIRLEATITEFIFVPNEIKDGSYLLNLQVAAFENNAAPSRPILFKFES